MGNDFHVHDEVVYAAQLEAYYRAGKGWGVVGGLTPAEKGAGADMSVDIGAGSAYLNQTAVTKGATTNVVVQAAHATLDRIDMATMTSAGVISMVLGNNESGAGEGDDYPAEIPDNAILLALVKVQASATTITTSDITDKRIFNTGLHDTTNGHKHDGSDSRIIREIQHLTSNHTFVNDATWTAIANWNAFTLETGKGCWVNLVTYSSGAGGGANIKVRLNISTGTLGVDVFVNGLGKNYQPTHINIQDTLDLEINNAGGNDHALYSVFIYNDTGSTVTFTPQSLTQAGDSGTLIAKRTSYIVIYED